jgi:hypothetical protein
MTDQTNNRAKLAREMTHYQPSAPRAPLDVGALVQNGLLGASLAPYPVGDVAGLLADAAMYYREPESRTWGNGLLSLAGALSPFSPGAASVPLLAGIIRDIKPPAWLKGVTSIPVGENPTRRELLEILRSAEDDALRVLLPKAEGAPTFFWPHQMSMHDPMARALGVNPRDYEHGMFFKEHLNP